MIFELYFGILLETLNYVSHFPVTSAVTHLKQTCNSPFLQQEARMSWAVELILAHVENLKKQHETLQEELEEARKKLLSDPDASPGFYPLLSVCRCWSDVFIRSLVLYS